MKVLSIDNLKKVLIPFLIALSFGLSGCYISILPFSSFYKYILPCISLIIILVYISRKKFSKFVVTFILYLIVLIISTLLNKTASIYLLAKSYFNILAVVLYFDMFKDNKENMKSKIFGWYYAYSLLIIINFITIVLYPDGLYRNAVYTTNWFLGFDNMHICYYFVAICFMYLKKYICNIKYNLFDLFILIIISYQVLYCFSANSVVAYSVFFILVFGRRIFKKIKLINIKNFYITYLLFNLLFVYYRIQDLFSWLIVDILGKKLNFSGRTFIWDQVMKYIKSKPILGYGKEDISIITSKLGNPAFAHAHNTILDVMYKSGVIGLFFYLRLLYITIIKLFEERSNELARILSALLFCFLILTVFEARQEVLNLYIILSMCYNVKYFIDIGDRNEQS